MWGDVAGADPEADEDKEGSGLQQERGRSRNIKKVEDDVERRGEFIGFVF